MFTEDEEGNRKRRIEKYFEVSAVVDVGCGDTKNSYILKLPTLKMGFAP